MRPASAPRGPRRRSLRRTLLLLGVWPCATVSIALTAWFTQERLRLLDDAFAAQGQAIARQVAALADLSLYAGDLDALQGIARSAVAAHTADRVEISNHAGIFVAAGGHPPPGAATGVSSAPVVLARWINLSDYPETPPTGPAPPLAGPPLPPAAAIGTVRIYRDTGLHQRERRRSLLAGLLPGLAGLLLAAFAARRANRAVAVPLRRIADALAELRHGRADLAPDALATHSRTPDELRALAADVDALALSLRQRQKLAGDAVRQARDEALTSVARVEQASRARARFLASASHDLRQPLHAMGLFIDSLRAADVPGQRVALQRLQDSTDIMGRLLDDLLDISRLDAQVLAPDDKPVALSALFAQLDAIHRAQADAQGTALVWRDGGLGVQADAALLQRILGNLVANAIRHSPGGRVLVAARRRRGDGSAGYVALEVRDNGAGIAPLHHARIFEEFFQVANIERDARKGFGLGLSICARIAAVLGTRIQLRSALQRGSTFSFRLPAAAAEPAPPPALPAAALPLGLHCLVVDDDTAILDASAMLLRQWGCHVETATHARAALARLARPGALFDVVLCDLQLNAATDGLPVLEEARRRHPGALHVLISGATSPDILRQLRQAGVALLTKPVAPARLRALLAGAQGRAGAERSGP